MFGNRTFLIVSLCFANVLCHSEERSDVRIAGNGHLVKECGYPSGRCVAHCTFEITLLQTIMLTLLLVCSFSPKVQSIFWGPRICDSALSLNKAMLRQILIL